MQIKEFWTLDVVQVETSVILQNMISTLLG
jgi:hypothetical protein